MRILPAAVLVMTLSATLPPCAIAAPTPNATGPGPCQVDVDKFCKNVHIGAGRIFACLLEHESQLSASCKSHLESRKQHREKERVENPNRAWVSACTADLQKLCKDIPAGRGRIVECLEQHNAALSAGCKSALSTRKTPAPAAK